MASRTGRGVNRMRDQPRSTTTDDEIIRRQWMLIDINPARSPGISASNNELAKENEVATALRAWPTKYACPGNNYHPPYRVNLPTTTTI